MQSFFQLCESWIQSLYAGIRSRRYNTKHQARGNAKTDKMKNCSHAMVAEGGNYTFAALVCSPLGCGLARMPDKHRSETLCITVHRLAKVRRRQQWNRGSIAFGPSVEPAAILRRDYHLFVSGMAHTFISRLQSRKNVKRGPRDTTIEHRVLKAGIIASGRE
jgi:hypothetical protein